jgi:shikimate dehydrogenase
LHLMGIEVDERRNLATDLRDKTGVSVEEEDLDEGRLKNVLPEARVLIHCTPVGMAPKIGRSCIPPKFLHRELIVMDVVYNPRETQLLIEARTAGCRTISGLEMFLYQAVAQFERWTGRSAPIQVMRAVLESRFP